MTKKTCLHITPHLGGGVGKVLSSLAEYTASSPKAFQHTIVCLEEPEKTQFVRVAQACGCEVVVTPSAEELYSRIESADIVQLEFWNHPAIVKLLCKNDIPKLRLVTWCHVSGLHFPNIPSELLRSTHRFMFTSKCSFESIEVRKLPCEIQKHLDVVSSGIGIENLPPPPTREANKDLVFGYLGSLNFSKLHPEYVSFLTPMGEIKNQVRLIGDETNKELLLNQCRAAGIPELLEFRGYRSDIVRELSELDVLIYILNPTHYGTAENALLEAMALGVIPIVLSNHAETHIVENGITGIVVNTPFELSHAVKMLTENPKVRLEISRNAAKSVRKTYTFETMVNKLNENYRAAMRMPKLTIPFTDIFGNHPSEWFLSFQRHPEIFKDDGTVDVPEGMDRYALFERTKGSVFHYLKYFPDDPLFQKWAYYLDTWKNEN